MDSDSSINLDSNNYKAYHLKGVGLIEIGKKEQSNKKIEEGIGFLIQCKRWIRFSSISQRDPY